jgi:hypothetical protein
MAMMTETAWAGSVPANRPVPWLWSLGCARTD